jgi:hypothetical protein
MPPLNVAGVEVEEGEDDEEVEIELPPPEELQVCIYWYQAVGHHQQNLHVGYILGHREVGLCLVGGGGHQ